MTTVEINELKNTLIPKHLEGLSCKRNYLNLLTAGIFIGLPLICQGVFLDGASMLDYSSVHHEQTTYVYLCGMIGLIMMMIGMILFLPLYFFGLTRNAEVVRVKENLVKEIDSSNEDGNFESFVSKIIEKANDVYRFT